MTQVFKINASAGSGKTYTLTRRFLNLLSGCDLNPTAHCYSEKKSSKQKKYNFSEILAVTFTNLAANQMKDRIILSLKNIALEQNFEKDNFTKEEALEALDYIFKHFSALNIKTIDSLLQQLVRISSLELELISDFETTFSEKNILEPLIREIASLAIKEDMTLQQYFLDFADILISSTQYFNKFLYSNQLKDLLSKIVLNLMSVVNENFNLQSVSNFIENDLQDFNHLNSLEYIFTQNQDDNFLSQMASQDDLNFICKDSKEKLIEASKKLSKIIEKEGLTCNKRFLTFLDALVSGEFKNSTYASYKSLETLLNKNSNLPSEKAEKQFENFKQEFTKSTSVKVFIEPAKKLHCLFELGKYLEQYLWQKEKSEGLILSSRVPFLVSKILSHDYYISAAFCRLGTKLNHILLDEFQDTSKEQWQAMEGLAREVISSGGSVFFVGDVKQAIYAWRGGDANLFDLAPANLTKYAEGNESNLDYNYRSSANIINWNNSFFKLFTSKKTILNFLTSYFTKSLTEKFENQDKDLLMALGMASDKIAHTYQNVKQEIPPSKLEKPEGLIQIHQPNLPSKYDNLAALGMLGICVDDLRTRYDLQDICILTFTNEQANTVSAFLMAKSIPVISQGSLLMPEQVIIQELIALLRFLNNPNDNKSFWEVIISKHILPYALDEQELFDFLAENANSKNFDNLFSAFNQKFSVISAYFFKPLLSKAGLMTAYDIINEIYHKFDIIRRNSGAEIFLLRLLELVHLAEENSFMDLTAFLNWWDEFSPEEKAPLAQNIGAITVMTVHKAKGLEFEAVVMPYLSLNVRIGQDIYEFMDYQYDDKVYKIYNNLNSESGSKHYEQLFDNALEKINNLYVAWTRPTKEMHVFLTKDDKAKSKLGINKLWEIFQSDDNFKPKDLKISENFASFGSINGVLVDESIINPLFIDFLQYIFCIEGEEFSDIYDNAKKNIEKFIDISELQIFYNDDFENNYKTESVYYAKVINQLFYKKIAKQKSINQGKISKKSQQIETKEKISTPELISALENQVVERPMAWLPRLKIFRKNVQELYNYPRLSANKRGIVIHKCLESLVYSSTPENDVQKVINSVLGYFSQSLMSEQETLQIKDNLLWFLNLQEPYGGTETWLTKGYKEHAIAGNDGNMYRVDLFVPCDLAKDDLAFLTIDYKTGYYDELPNKDNVKQIQKYLQLLQNAMGTKKVKGLLIYLDRKEIHLVNPL